jgi:hypothetical protein
MGFGRGSGLFVRPAQLGLLASNRLRDAVARFVTLIEGASSAGEPADGAVRIDVWGEADGKEVHHIACGTGQMREATGLSLSVGTQMLARRELLTHHGGVYAPEACLDPHRFLIALSDRGIKAYRDLAMTRQVP